MPARYQSTALLLIDVQQGLDSASLGQRNNPRAEEHMASLLTAWRKRQAPIIHIRHCSTEAASPLRPKLPGNAFKEEVLPAAGEPVFRKSANSAFIGTSLERYLRSAGISRLVVTGLTTDHCVSATTRTASDLGFDVILVSDATAAFGRTGYDGTRYSAEDIHRISLVTLDGEFCEVRSTADILAEIIKA